MHAYVTIACPKCNSVRPLVIAGRWDVKNVDHTCPTTEHPSGIWVITFDPPRPIY